MNRQFRVQRPGQLHVADFTYVPLVTGRFCYTAFVIDAFAGLIPGWECSMSKETEFIERRAADAARRRPAIKGWPAPMGLDDEKIDDPTYRPRAQWRPATGTGAIPPICSASSFP